MEKTVIYTMVTKSLNVKFVAAFAVLAMMLAGVGAFFVADTNDAADEPTGDITISFPGAPATMDATAFAPGVVKIRVQFVEENFGNITMLDYDTYNSMVKPFLAYEEVDGTAVPVAYFGVDDFDLADPMFMKVLKTLVANDDVAGATSGAIVFDMALKTPVKIATDDQDVAAAIATGIATAFATVPEGYMSPAEVEEMYADYMSPEEVAEAIDAAVKEAIDNNYTQEELDEAVAKAVADTTAKFADYKSPAQVQEIVDKAIADYKAANPVKADDTYLYMFIVALAIAIVLAGIMIFTRIVQPRLKAAGKI